MTMQLLHISQTSLPLERLPLELNGQEINIIRTLIAREIMQQQRNVKCQLNADDIEIIKANIDKLLDLLERFDCELNKE